MNYLNLIDVNCEKQSIRVAWSQFLKKRVHSYWRHAPCSSEVYNNLPYIPSNQLNSIATIVFEIIQIYNPSKTRTLTIHIRKERFTGIIFETQMEEKYKYAFQQETQRKRGSLWRKNCGVWGKLTGQPWLVAWVT